MPNLRHLPPQTVQLHASIALSEGKSYSSHTTGAAWYLGPENETILLGRIEPSAFHSVVNHVNTDVYHLHD
jgi:hypothetical protein